MPVSISRNDPRLATLAVTLAIVETIAESPDGAPEGIMFAAICDRITGAQFSTFLDSMRRAGLIERRGYVAHVTPAGRSWIVTARARLDRAIAARAA